METLARLVPFTRDVYLGVFERYNDAIWPVQIVAYLLVSLALWSALRPFPGSGRLIAAILAAGWLWTGGAYYMLTYSQINWAGWAFGLVFAAQGLAFLATGVIRDRLVFRFSGDVAGWIGLVVVAASAILYPLIGVGSDQAWPRVALVGVTPGPTLLWTLGMLLLVALRVPWHLLFIPLIWSLAEGFGAALLGLPQDAALPIAAIAAIVAIVLRMRRARSIRP